MFFSEYQAQSVKVSAAESKQPVSSHFNRTRKKRIIGFLAIPLPETRSFFSQASLAYPKKHPKTPVFHKNKFADSVGRPELLERLEDRGEVESWLAGSHRLHLSPKDLVLAPSSDALCSQ